MPHKYRKFQSIATQIEDLADEALKENGDDEPIRTPLLNIKGAVSQLRDANEHAQGQKR